MAGDRRVRTADCPFINVPPQLLFWAADTQCPRIGDDHPDVLAIPGYAPWKQMQQSTCRDRVSHFDPSGWHTCSKY